MNENTDDSGAVKLAKNFFNRPALETMLWFSALLLNGFVLGLRSRYASFDLDEFQHSHIAWNLVRGKIIYRDFFEHHGPLYAFFNQALFTFLNLPARFDSLLTLRIGALAFALGILLLTAALAWQILRSPRLVLISLTTLSSLLFFQRKSIEVRPDGMQNFFWLLGLIFFFFSRQTFKRWPLAAAGAAWGLALLANFKAVLFLGFVGLAWLCTALCHRRPWQPLRRDVFLIAVGLAAAFAPFAVYFWHVRALDQAIYFNTRYNFWLMRHGFSNTTLEYSVFFGVYQTMFVMLLTLSIGFALLKIRTLDQDADERTAIFAVLCLLCLSAPLAGLYSQFYLAFLPVLAIGVAWGIEQVLKPARDWRRTMLAALIVFGFERSVVADTPWRMTQRQIQQRELTEYVLQNTSRDEAIGFFWNECGGYMFNDDVQYAWLAAEDIPGFYHHVTKRNLYGLDFVHALETKHVRYIVGWRDGFWWGTPPRTRAALQERYEPIGPCLWRQKPTP